WIRLASPGSSIFMQVREGKGRRPIGVYKLRTMHPDADVLLLRHLGESTDAQQEWDRYCKLKRDPRILSGIGHFLRRTSLDELPQLWNVLKGDMSLVGPRPFPAYHNEKFGPQFRDLRCKVRPGLTGLWQ